MVIDVVESVDGGAGGEEGEVAKQDTAEQANIAVAQKAFSEAVQEGKLAFAHCTHTHTHAHARTHTHTHTHTYTNTYTHTLIYEHTCAAKWQTMFDAAKKNKRDYGKFKFIMADPWYQEDKKPTDADLVHTRECPATRLHANRTCTGADARGHGLLRH